MTNNDKDTHNRLIENNIDMGEKILDFDVKKNTAPAAAIKIIGVGGGRRQCREKYDSSGSFGSYVSALQHRPPSDGRLR